jgi:hypothetical protein
MRTNWTKISTKRTNSTGGLMIPAVIAALLMAMALAGCNTGGDFVARESVTGLPERAEAVGQDNGSIRDSVPTAGDYERLQRRPAAFMAVDRTPRADARHLSSER